MAARTGAEAEAMQTTWAAAVEQVKRSVNAPIVYRALERTVPIAWEDGVFVIGFSPGEGHFAGSLSAGETFTVTERALQTLTGEQALRFRVIEGADYADWDYVKARDAAAAISRQQNLQKRTVETKAFGTWDDIYERISRLWASQDYRSLPTGRGRFMDTALNQLLEAMEVLYPAEGTKAEESTERGLSRVVDRIASMTNSDPAFIAYLLFERRRLDKSRE